MPIVIARVNDLYHATVTPPHAHGRHWQTPQPMELRALIAKLHALGCHPTDVGDALHDADPEWEFRIDDP